MRLTTFLPLLGIGVATSFSARRPSSTVPLASRAPSQANAAAIAEGSKLFVAYNCGDCHGAGGSGLMAPSLADNRWRYGGSPTQVYASIVDGRPQGMPEWGPSIPVDHVRKLVAYIRTLGEGKDVTTMNFTGPKVERTGH